MDEEGAARPLREDPPPGEAGALRPCRRHLGRAGLQHPRRRIPRAPVPVRPTALPEGVRDHLPRVLEPGRLRLQRPVTADHARRRDPVLRDAEAVLEPVQQAPTPDVLVGGHRRQPRNRCAHRSGSRVPAPGPGGWAPSRTAPGMSVRRAVRAADRTSLRT